MPCYIKSLQHSIAPAYFTLSNIDFWSGPGLGLWNGMTHTTLWQRHRVVDAWRGSGNIAAAARTTGTSQKSARRWVQRFLETQDVLEKPKTGRPPSMSHEAATRAHALLLGKPNPTAAEVAQQLYSEGYTAAIPAKSTVIKHARELGEEVGVQLVVYRGRPARQLTASTKAKRLAFATDNLGQPLYLIMYTDRKKFMFRYPGTSYRVTTWGRKGCKREAPNLSRPQCVNLYMGLTHAGVTKCHIVAGTSKHKTKYCTKKGQRARNITSAEYADVLEHTLLPDAQRLFNQMGISRGIIQMDNDPAHRDAARTVEKFNRSGSTSISILPGWPPNSPDLSPIENVWGWVQGKVHAMACKNFDSFKKAVLDVCQSVPKAMLARLVDSVHGRLAEVMASGGDRTRH